VDGAKFRFVSHVARSLLVLIVPCDLVDRRRILGQEPESLQPRAVSPSKTIGAFADPKKAPCPDQQRRDEYEYFAPANEKSGITP
jgi:hypothetical protein